jgi:CDP-glucose 4,6-dehydratase
VGVGLTALEDVVTERRPVFVTGGYGLLGTWLVKALLESGEHAVLLQRDIPARSGLGIMGLEARCDVVHGDLTDAPLMQRVLGEFDVGTVFHLAAQTLVGTARQSPLSTWETNVRGTWVLLEACRLHGMDAVVVAASDKAYGAHEELPYREDFALRPTFPYDVSKAATDLIARSYFHTYGVPVATTRFANIYGGGDFNASRLVPEAVVAALEGRSPVIRSDGTPERDFLYVEDAVAAYLAIREALLGGEAGGEAFNGGGGEPHAVLEVVRLVCEAAGSAVAPDVRGTGTPAAEIDRQYVDASKLRGLTGWEPRVSLEEGIRRTVAWYRDHAVAPAAT